MQKKYNVLVYLDNCAYKILDKRMIDYLGENPFETDEKQVLQMLYYDRTDISEGIYSTNYTIGFLIMGLSFKIMFVILAMIE